MGILDKIGDAAGSVVDGAKDLLGFDEKKEEPIEAAAEVDVENVAVAEADEMAQATEAVYTETPRTYTVQSGDTLSEISQQYYGNSHDYTKIFEANRDQLSDPDKIRVGQELVIPE